MGDKAFSLKDLFESGEVSVLYEGSPMKLEPQNSPLPDVITSGLSAEKLESYKKLETEEAPIPPVLAKLGYKGPSQTPFKKAPSEDEPVEPFTFATLFKQELNFKIESSYHDTLMEILYGVTSPAKKKQEELNRELSRAAVKLPGADQMARCPGCLEHYSTIPWVVQYSPLLSVIAHLNDDHKWDRNKIADWLDVEADAGRLTIDFPTPNEGE